ncbi:unnamed protein product [Urochloa humidicola]
MQGGRGGRHGLFSFGDPFAGFGGSGQPGSLTSSFFGGANPFDDSFFTNPFGSMMQHGFPTPFASMMQPGFMNPFASMMRPRLLGPSMFVPHTDLSGGMFGSQTNLNQVMGNASGFIQQVPEPSRPKGPIIKELSSDDEDDARDDKEDEKEKVNLRKHPRESKGPYVEDPDDEVEDNKRPKLEHLRGSSTGLAHHIRSLRPLCSRARLFHMVVQMDPVIHLRQLGGLVLMELHWKKVRRLTQLLVKLLTGFHVALAVRVTH